MTIDHGSHDIAPHFYIKIVRAVDWSTLSMNFARHCPVSIFDVSKNAA